LSETGDDVALATAAVARGEAVVYPTETIYGIGVDARSIPAVERLIALKGRDAAKGISVLVAGRDDVGSLSDRPIPPEALRLMEEFWPGSLTIVLPAAASVIAALVGPSGGIGFRCTADPVAVRLVEACGAPLTSTSANSSGDPPAVNVEQACDYFGERVSYYLDGGPRSSSAPSTVVEFCDAGVFLRRAGVIGVSQLQRFVSFASS
jgi:tRNA threonylcarbamoyl adenosine modification protein (Sua5/YciO/YrdC/YwlC family)